MAERLGDLLRPTGMRIVLLGLVLGLSLVLGGCGDAGTSPRAAESPSATTSPCTEQGGAVDVSVAADLDGDGQAETVDYVDNPDCRALHATVAGRQVSTPVDGEMALRHGDLEAVRIPGRTGDVVLAKQQQPRGGFQARLYGYADGKLAELTAEGRPIFHFIATDVLTTPTAVECTDGGFTVTEARAHEPVGVVPAWDVYRTTYTVEGNNVTKGATSEAADNVLDAQLQRQYGHLVTYDFFWNCLAGPAGQ